MCKGFIWLEKRAVRRDFLPWAARQLFTPCTSLWWNRVSGWFLCRELGRIGSRMKNTCPGILDKQPSCYPLLLPLLPSAGQHNHTRLSWLCTSLFFLPWTRISEDLLCKHQPIPYLCTSNTAQHMCSQPMSPGLIHVHAFLIYIYLFIYILFLYIFILYLYI